MVDERADEAILVTDNLPKSKPAYMALKTVIGKTSLVAIEGDHWKRLRKMFNPAFAPSHLETMIPYIVEESNVFVEKLNQVAQSGETVRMNELTTVLYPWNWLIWG
jgi:cytochrome P450